MTTMDIDKRSDKSHELGLKYAEAQHQEALVVKDEDTRRQKVKTILVREENERLKNTVAHLNGRVDDLEARCRDGREELARLTDRYYAQEAQLRAQTREHAALQSKLASLGDATDDSAKHLTEKLALSRELAMLKPEVDHLRSQLAHQQDVLAEKLALERQLNTLEVELANEKRNAQRAAERQTLNDRDAAQSMKQQIQDLEKKLANEQRARETLEKEQDARTADNASQSGQLDAATAKLQARVKELERAVEAEKRESVRAKRSLETELAEARGQNDVFEQRVGDLKSKLRGVREELKSVSAELAEAQTSRAPAKAARAGVSVPLKEAAPAKKTTAASKSKLKRRAEEPSGPNPVMQTPGAANEGRAKRPLKKRGFDVSAVVLQKSDFSITPFLNKTINPMDETTETPAAVPANASQQSAGEDSSDAMDDAPAAGDDSELPEDSIMGGRVPASAQLSSVDLHESSASTVVAKLANGEGVKRRGRQPKEKVLGDALVSKKSNRAPSPAADAPSASSASSAPAPAPATTAPKTLKEKKSAAAASKAASEPEPKKKKRKILGASNKTIFVDDDEDDDRDDRDDEMPARPVPAPVAAGGAKRAVKPLGGAGPTAGGPARRKMIGVVRNAFGGSAGGFSPLKRDRRGVNASFLA